MITLRNLDHLVLRVQDPARMVAFYRDVLGCQVERTLDELGLIQLRAGTALIDLVDVAGKIGRQGGGAPGRGGRNLDHFCLRLEPFDPDAVLRHLARHGITAGPFERRYGADGFGPSIYIEDPEGNTVELKGSPETA